MKDLKLDQSFSGQFAVYRVVHNFSGGVFRQNIEAVRLEFQGQFPELSLKDQESRDAKAEIARQLGQTVPDQLGIGNQTTTDFGLLPENLNIDVSNVTAGIGDT